jgi:hypothetical protein
VELVWRQKEKLHLDGVMLKIFLTLGRGVGQPVVHKRLGFEGEMTVDPPVVRVFMPIRKKYSSGPGILTLPLPSWEPPCLYYKHVSTAYTICEPCYRQPFLCSLLRRKSASVFSSLLVRMTLGRVRKRLILGFFS